MPFDRAVFFDTVRPMFGSFNQGQVDGMNFVLDVWEEEYEEMDLRWCAYPLATDMWETSSTMQPIEEYGKGEGMAYGKSDPTTKQTYYGRGYTQLTWRDNYAKADRELGLSGELSCEWHAENALDPSLAAAIMFKGMMEGWFRTGKDGKPETLGKYFNDTTDDPFNAREIINGDKNYTKEWADNEKVGNLIAGYYQTFLHALSMSYREDIGPEQVVTITIEAPPGVRVDVKIVAPEA